jgi:hypothetical protein
MPFGKPSQPLGQKSEQTLALLFQQAAVRNAHNFRAFDLAQFAKDSPGVV